MQTEIITLADGIEIEAEIRGQQISAPGRIADATIERIKPLLITAVRPVVAAWKEMSEFARIEKTEVEISFSVANKGNFFIANVEGKGAVKVKLTLAAPRGNS